MSQSWERNQLADLQSGLQDDDYDSETLMTKLFEHNAQYYPLGDAPLSSSFAEANPVEALPTHIPKLNENMEIGDYLGESLECLELNGNDGFSNSEVSDSTCGKTHHISMDADLAQLVPKTIDTMLMPEFSNNGIYQAHSIVTPSQTFNDVESSSPLPQSGRWSGGNPNNLRPPTYTPHKSSAATHSQYSDSAWETIPSTPSDYDLRPIPDVNSASMQSYNDAQTGIWPQENIQGRGDIYLPKMGMGFGNDTDSTATRLINEKLQEVIANADAATPFGTVPHSNGGALLGNAALNAYGGAGMAALSFSPQTITGGLAPHLVEPPSNGQSGAFITIDRMIRHAALPIQRLPVVEHSFLPPGSDRKILPNTAPKTVLDNPSLLPTKLPPTMLVDSAASTSSPPVESDASNTGVAKCIHRGCRRKFNGATRKDTLRRHIRIEHGNIPKPICPECDLVIQSGRRDNLKRHIKEIHPGHPQSVSRKVGTKKTGSRTAASQHRGVSKMSSRPT